MGFGYNAFDDPLGQYRPEEHQSPPQMGANAFAPGGFNAGVDQGDFDWNSPPDMAAPAMRPPMQPMATPRQMANADPNAEYLKRLDEGAVGDMSSALRSVGSAIGGAAKGAYNWMLSDQPLSSGVPTMPSRNMGPLKPPANQAPLQTPRQPYGFPSMEQNRADVRKQGLESQGFSEAMPGQFIKISGNSNRPMNQGFGKTWTPAGQHGAFSGANSFTSPDIEAQEKISDNDRMAAIAQSKQRVAVAQMQPQQAHPDPFQQRVRAAAAIVGPEHLFKSHTEWLAAMQATLNALVRGNFDQSALGGLPNDLTSPQ